VIIVKIFQGLGNQMFQYAYGYARSKDLGTELKIDTSYYQSYSEVTQFGYTYKRDFGLNRFNIEAKEATITELNGVLYPRAKSLRGKISNKYRQLSTNYNKKFYVKEPDYSFDKRLLQIVDNTYVEGYFTDERYFAKYRDGLIKQFALLNPPNEKNNAILNQMEMENSVCISIRRTNFLNNPLMGTCGEAYYYKAMDEMASKIPNPVFYVFSDDNNWVSSFFKSGYNCVFMQHNYPDFYEDFRLMQKCKHHIIPNSTFPWWAAWLSNYENKLVIAPKYWLNSNTIDYSRFVPGDWIRIEHSIDTKFTGD
jgi:hypothetical protein